MKHSPVDSHRIIGPLNGYVVAAGAYALLGGFVSLLGYLLHAPRLSDWAGSGIAIQPNSCVAPMLLGAALLLLASRSGRWHAIAAGMGFVVAAMGATILAQHVTGSPIRWFNEALIFDREWGRIAVKSPGLVGPPGGLSWMLLGSTVAMLALGRGRALAAALSLTTLFVASISLVGYWFGAEALYTLPSLTVIAMQTATFVLVASIGLIIANPGHGLGWLLLQSSLVGFLARRTALGIVLVALLVGFLRVEGERAGLYTSAFGSAVRTIVEIALMLALLWWTTRPLARQAEALRQSEEKFSRLFHLSPVAKAVTSIPEHRFVEVNEAFERLTGYARDDLVGRTAVEVGLVTDGADRTERLRHIEKDGSRLEFEEEIRCRNGETKKLLGALQAMEVGNVQAVVTSLIDVTADRTAREAIETSRRVIRNLIERAPFGIYVVDSDFRLASVNKGSQDRAFANVRPLIGRPFDEVMRILWPEPLATDLIATFRNTLSTGEPYFSRDFVSPRADTDEVEAYEWELHQIEMPDGSCGVVCYYYDSTELRRTEKALREGVRRQAALVAFAEKLQVVEQPTDIYESALDSIMDALDCDRASILLFDEAEVMRFVASRGLSQEYRRAVEGHSPWTPDSADPAPITIADVERADVQAELKEVVLREGIVSLAFIPLVASGRVLGKFMAYCDVRHEFTQDELDVAITIGRQLAISIDRRRAQSALDVEEQRLRVATNTGNVGVWDWDVRRNVVRWTDSLYRLFGVPQGSFGGTVEAFAEIVHPDDRPRVQEAIRRALEQGEAYNIEFRAVHPDGTVVWIYTNGTVASDENGPVSMIGATLDVTKTKEAEAKLANWNEELKRLVEERTAGLLRANEQLQGFTYSVAHDFRQQIRGISTNAAIVLEDGSNLDEESRFHLERVVRSAKQMAELSDDLLQYARLGTHPLRKDHLDLSEIAEEVAAVVGPKHGGCDVAIEPGMTAVGDARLVRLALENLLDNACKYSSNGQPSVVRFGQDRNAFFVSDNGIGFDMRYYDKVFQPFERLHTADEFEGTGIGLANVKRIVERHGGRVWAESSLGKGTTFWFTLSSEPVGEGASAETAPATVSV